MFQPLCTNPIILSLILFLFLSLTQPKPSTMKKIHPIPVPNKRIRDADPSSPRLPPKRLCRLPHVFAKTLELPLHADAHVAIHETPNRLRFVADVADGKWMTARAVEIYPGVTKVIVRNEGDEEEEDKMVGVDTWRFRLPREARVERATAMVTGGELVVTVPMGESLLGGARLALVH